VGLSAGAVAFIDPGEARVTEIMPLAREDQEEQEEDLTSMRLWPAADGRAAVFDGDDFYLVQPGHDATGESSAVQMDIQHPSESARLLAASGPRIIWGLSADELLIAGTSEPGPGVKLTAHYSTDEGFTAAAMSSDGTVIAAICDSFLHVWRSMAAGSDYEYLTMTPQQGGRCVDVSADGRYITVGTRAGSACIYLTRPIEEE